jgi:hypothetical protein
MKKTYLIIAISRVLVEGCYTAPPYPPSSHVSVGVGYPGVNIGINFSTYPDLVQIPGYPVYYGPRVDSNYFFYDGLYWVFLGDDWYASSWYNGPWDRVDYYDVPAYVLRVPVRYYRQPPSYFRGWRADAPPRWGDHWGRDWEQRRSGWDRWDRGSVPVPAPLPTYQRNYSGDRYPRAVEQQHTIRSEYYRYQPREPVTQQYFKPRVQQEQQDQRQQDQRQQDQRQQDQRQQDQRQQDQRQQDQRQQDQRQQDQRQQDQRQQDQRQQDQRQQDQRQQDQRQQDQRQQDQRQQGQRQLDQRQKERQQAQQRQQQQKQQQDLEQKRAQPEAQGQDQKRKATQQEPNGKKGATQEELDRKKKEEDARDRYRQ